MMIIRETTREDNVYYFVEILPLLSVDLLVQFDTCVICNGDGDVVGNDMKWQWFSTALPHEHVARTARTLICIPWVPFTAL